MCQRESCPNAGNAEATKVCYDHNISITYAPDSPPPLYLCIECANEIHRENTNQIFGDILHPMAQVSMICENKVRAKKYFNFQIDLTHSKIVYFPFKRIANRIAVQPTNQLFQFVFLRNVPVIMEIIRFDIVHSVMEIGIIVAEVVITLCMKV